MSNNAVDSIQLALKDVIDAAVSDFLLDHEGEDWPEESMYELDGLEVEVQQRDDHLLVRTRPMTEKSVPARYWHIEVHEYEPD